LNGDSPRDGAKSEKRSGPGGIWGKEREKGKRVKKRIWGCGEILAEGREKGNFRGSEIQDGVSMTA
jgi:hypothetical protein